MLEDFGVWRILISSETVSALQRRGRRRKRKQGSGEPEGSKLLSWSGSNYSAGSGEPEGRAEEGGREQEGREEDSLRSQTAKLKV